MSLCLSPMLFNNKTFSSACITALSNPQYGILVLPATIQLCFSLAKLAMTLDKRPDLTSRLRKIANVDQGESRKSLVEGTAESIQRAFTICLTERSSNRNGIGKDGKPEGKKVGIYSFANLVLKLLFQVCHLHVNNECASEQQSVQENSTGKPAFHQYITALTTASTIPRQPESHISLLSRPVPVL
jgi:hypothetical protein